MSNNPLLQALMQPLMTMVDRYLDVVVSTNTGSPSEPASTHAIAQTDDDVVILLCAYRVRAKHMPILKRMALDHSTRFDAELKFVDESLKTSLVVDKFAKPADDADATGAH